MKTLTNLTVVAFTVGILVSSHAQADWALDFEDGRTATDWRVGGDIESSIVEHGGDHIVWIRGNASWGGIYQTDSLSDVRVAATINPSGDTDDSVGLFSRNPSYGDFYGATLNYLSGELRVWKAVNSQGGPQFLGVVGPVDDLTGAYHLEFDVVGENPPLLTARLFDFAGGTELLSVSGVDEDDNIFRSGAAGTFATAQGDGLHVTYDNVSVTTIVPGPSTTCDLDNDGLCSVADIDLIYGVGDISGSVSVPPADPVFDLNADDVVDIHDVDQWLADAATQNGFGSPYLKGDANVDGSVNAEDLNSLALNWQQTAVWSGGDFTGEGTVDAADLNVLALNWQSSIPLAAAPIPEPSTITLALLSIVFLGGWRRRL